MSPSSSTTAFMIHPSSTTTNTQLHVIHHNGPPSQQQYIISAAASSSASPAASTSATTLPSSITDNALTKGIFDFLVPPAHAADTTSSPKPPTNAEIKLLREAFAALYGERNPEKAEGLLGEAITSWERQAPDERAALNRVRGDCYMVRGSCSSCRCCCWCCCCCCCCYPSIMKRTILHVNCFFESNDDIILSFHVCLYTVIICIL
jgi:hypothetical protein